MNKFEKAVAIICKEFSKDKKRLNAENIKEVFESYDYSTQDIKDEYLYILDHSPDFDPMDVTDDCEIIDGDKIYSFRALNNAVKKH